MPEERDRLRELERLFDATVPRLNPDRAMDIVLSELSLIREKEAQQEIQNLLSETKPSSVTSNQEKLKQLRQLCKLGYDPQTAWRIVSSGMDLNALNSLPLGIPHNQSAQFPTASPISTSQWNTVPVGHQTVTNQIPPTNALALTEKSNIDPRTLQQPENYDLNEEIATKRGWGVVIGVILICIVMALVVNMGGFQAVQSFIDDKLELPGSKPQSKLPSGQPLAAVPRKGEKIGSFLVTSGYGWRTHPILKIRKFHSGIDVGAPFGFWYKMPGAVGTKGSIACGYDPGSGFKAYVTSDDPRYINTKLIVCHMQANSCIPGVHTAGSPFGKLGSTGLSTAPHLHLSVKINGKLVPPSRTFAEEVLGVPS